MGKFKAVIDGLGLVSIALEMVPGVGENLKSAAELLSTICEQVQVHPSRLSNTADTSSPRLDVSTCCGSTSQYSKRLVSTRSEDMAD
jgi:hypothetical protein